MCSLGAAEIFSLKTVAEQTRDLYKIQDSPVNTACTLTLENLGAFLSVCALLSVAPFFLRLSNIEKEKTGHLYNRRSDFRVEYRLLEDLEHSMTVSRKTESK